MPSRVDRRGAGLVAGVVGAVMLVALASRGDHGGRGDSIVAVTPEATSLTQTILLVVLGVLTVGVLLLVIQSLSVNKPDLEAQRHPWRRFLVTMLLLVVVAIVLSRVHPHRAEQVLDGGAGSSVDEPVPARGGGEPAGSPAWGIGAAGVLVLVAGAIAVTVVTHRRRAVAPPMLPHSVAATEEERDDAVARAHACTDPREAVLLAFAAAEAVLSDDPATRRPVTTSAREWSSHVRLAPLATIVARYEIARFSDHVVTERDRQVALDALSGLT